MSGLFSSEYPSQVTRIFGLTKKTSYRHYQSYRSSLKGFNPKVKAFALIPTVVTRHTTAWCSMQVWYNTNETPFHSYYIAQSGTTETYAVQGMSIELQHRLFTKDPHSLLLYNEVKLQINSRRTTRDLILSQTLFKEYLTS